MKPSSVESEVSALKRFLILWIVLMMLVPPCAFGEEEEFSYTQIVPAPHVTITVPQAGQSYDAGGKLHVQANGKNVLRMEVILTYEGETTTLSFDGGNVDYTFDTPQYTQGAVVTVIGYGENDIHGYPTESRQTVSILSPRDKLFQDMFNLAAENYKDPYYYHAPAKEDWDRGICKNFVKRLFDTFKDAYAMKEYPDLELHMPLNNSKKNCAPYDYGIEWRIESAEDGSPFEIAAQFKYDADKTKEENRALCRAVLESVQAGDFFQMTGDYYYGKGAHSLLFIADYDPGTDEVRWTDSNMKNDSVNGYHYGYMQYNAVKDIGWFIDAVCYKLHGCTLYRLREDLFIK